LSLCVHPHHNYTQRDTHIHFPVCTNTRTHTQRGTLTYTPSHHPHTCDEPRQPRHIWLQHITHIYHSLCSTTITHKHTTIVRMTADSILCSFKISPRTHRGTQTHAHPISLHQRTHLRRVSPDSHSASGCSTARSLRSPRPWSPPPRPAPRGCEEVAPPFDPIPKLADPDALSAATGCWPPLLLLLLPEHASEMRHTALGMGLLAKESEARLRVARMQGVRGRMKMKNTYKACMELQET